QRQRLALEVDAGVDLGVPASLALSKSPFFRSLPVAASVLMDLDEAGVDDLETVVPVLLGVAGEQRGEDSLLRPAQMKAVNAVPFPAARRELVPLAAGDQNPPDPIECFSKIGRLSALFENVRSRLGRVKLIFRRLKSASGIASARCFMAGLHTCGSLRINQLNLSTLPNHSPGPDSP